MSDAKQSTPIEPNLSWHFFNAVTCTGLWFLAFAFSISGVVALSSLRRIEGYVFSAAFSHIGTQYFFDALSKHPRFSQNS